MIARELSMSLQVLFATDEQTRGWMAAAHTPETRVLIRRWSRIETVGMVLLLIGIALLVIAPFGSIAVAVWAGVTDTDRSVLHWWIWGLTIGVFAAGITASMVATGRRERACFADGQVSVGTVDRAIEHPGSGDDHTWYDLRISAALPNGVTLCRRLHLEGERWGRRVGHSVRFRHNTLDPDAFDDVLFDGWPDSTGGGQS